MLHRALPGTLALLGLLAGPVARAGDYSSGPQVRLGIDILWGGAGYVQVAPPPVVVWQPVPVRPRYAYHPGYDHGYEHGYAHGYDRAQWRGKGHRKHHRKHRHHRGDD